MYDQSFNVKSECVALSKCPDALDSPTAPYENLPCGFDTDLSQLKICCPTQNVTEPQVSVSHPRTAQINLHYQDLAQPPRFPARSGKARTVKDKTEFCSQWKRHGACELDRDFSLSEEDDLNAQVYSKQMFDLMQKTCPKTCGWVESGCHDEHPRCQEWARRGICTVNNNPSFMAHTCRESCGVCGLLSLHNLVSILTSARLSLLLDDFV